MPFIQLYLFCHCVGVEKNSISKNKVIDGLRNWWGTQNYIFYFFKLGTSRHISNNGLSFSNSHIFGYFEAERFCEGD